MPDSDSLHQRVSITRTLVGKHPRDVLPGRECLIVRGSYVGGGSRAQINNFSGLSDQLSGGGVGRPSYENIASRRQRLARERVVTPLWVRRLFRSGCFFVCRTSDLPWGRGRGILLRAQQQAIQPRLQDRHHRRQGRRCPCAIHFPGTARPAGRGGGGRHGRRPGGRPWP